MTIQPFISELIKATNQINRLTEMEKSRLLDRAGRTIQDMREETGVRYRPEDDEVDAAWDLRRISRNTADFTQDEIQSATLDAVEMLKTLQGMLAAKHQSKASGDSTEGA